MKATDLCHICQMPKAMHTDPLRCPDPADFMLNPSAKIWPNGTLGDDDFGDIQMGGIVESFGALDYEPRMPCPDPRKDPAFLMAAKELGVTIDEYLQRDVHSNIQHNLRMKPENT